MQELERNILGCHTLENYSINHLRRQTLLTVVRVNHLVMFRNFFTELTAVTCTFITLTFKKNHVQLSWTNKRISDALLFCAQSIASRHVHKHICISTYRYLYIYVSIKTPKNIELLQNVLPNKVYCPCNKWALVAKQIPQSLIRYFYDFVLCASANHACLV